MNKIDFLSNAHVAGFRMWLAQRLDKSGSFVHSYDNRQKSVLWECDCLYSAFENYQWPFSCGSLGFQGRTFDESRIVLDILQRRLRIAFEQQHLFNTATACIGILEWGGVIAKNRSWIEGNRDRLFQILENDMCLLTDPSPTLEKFKSLFRFNAGFVKIYSLLLDGFIIYDGRVGAALGRLVRDYCLDANLMRVPELLRFPWSPPKEAKNMSSPKNRNPSSDGYKFPKLNNQKDYHALWTIYASWLLKDTLSNYLSRFSMCPSPLRALEAALFMIGYDLGNLQGGE
jgi:hypothetical protein